MCIIVYKPKGKAIPSDDILKNCFKINGDGSGLMFSHNGAVYIRKGYETFDALKNALNYYDERFNLSDKDLVLHFRIATSGGISKAKCHPFPISDDIDKLNAPKLETSYGVVHNGVLSDYVYGNLSDTQNYIRDYIHPLFELKSDLNNPNITRLIQSTLGTCKLIILNKKGDVLRLGEWKEDDGIYYSNLTYKTSYYTSSTKEVNYSNYWSNWQTKSKQQSLLYNDPFYDEYEDATMNYYNSLFYDITESHDYKLIKDDVIVYDAKNPTIELTNSGSVYDLFIDSSGYCYEIDWSEQTADYLGRVLMFDKNGNPLKFEDL